MDDYTGKRIDGRYEIQEVIGVGGMAVVYKAYDNIDDRIVAVKILKDEFLANEEFRRRFKNESKAISLLSHPNIVKIYNVNYGDRLQYIVMEYVEGITLKEYIEQQGHLGIKETIHFTMQILRALQHAHDKGIIHRDIKPQNILLLSNGNIKVTDFGIARFSYSNTKTMTDSAIGSVHYISPEQARGQQIDERTDIYSVGVVMYEMLTGRLPFVSENSVSVAIMQLQNDPKRISEINPNIPVGLEQIVNRAMSKDTKTRYQAASEMLLDIEEFKRNPNIKFEQSYFVDNDPTKYATAVKKEQLPPQIKPSSRQIVLPGDEDDDDAPRSRAPAIVAGIIIGLLTIAGLVFGALYFFTDMFNKEYSVVPGFIGKNYEQEIANNNDYRNTFTFTVVKEANSLLTDGTVSDQTPSEGTKISSTPIEVRLTVVDNAQPIIIPDVSGMNWEKAQTTLENKGFKVNLLPVTSTVDDYGTVIKTIPAANTEASCGDIVTIYYASDDELIEVPTVVGWNVATAKEKLESMNLTLNEDYTTQDSDLPKGQIITQNPVEGDKVIPGTRITVVVSSGVPETSKANITIKLPVRSGSTDFEVYVNNERVIKKSMLMDGSQHTFSVEGSGSGVPVKVYIEGSEYFSCTANFNSNPAGISHEIYSSSGTSSPSASLPSVVGENYESAISKLKNAGFTNVSTTYAQTYDPAQNGRVISQSPQASTSTPILGLPNPNTLYSTDTRITIVVGQMEGVGQSQSETQAAAEAATTE